MAVFNPDQVKSKPSHSAFFLSFANTSCNSTSSTASTPKDAMPPLLSGTTQKKKSQRNWRHWLLLLCVPLTLLLGSLDVLRSITFLWSSTEATLSESKTASFSFIDELSGDLPLIANKIIVIEACHVAAAGMNLTYFVLFWHRNDRTYLRSIVALGLSSIAIALNFASLPLKDELALLPLDVSAILSHRPDLKGPLLHELHNTWLQGFTEIRYSLLYSVPATVIQAAAVAFWVCLLPARCRLPNRYEPVIKLARRRFTKEQNHTQIELDQTDAPNVGPIAAVFEEHEKARDKTYTTKSQVNQVCPMMRRIEWVLTG